MITVVTDTTYPEEPVTITGNRYRLYQEAEIERDQLRADLREAVDALRPFTQTVTTAVNPRYDPAYVMTPFTYEDCAHAHAIVEKHKEPKP